LLVVFESRATRPSSPSQMPAKTMPSEALKKFPACACTMV